MLRKDGHFYRYGIRIVRYADDFILMANKIPEHSLVYLQSMLSKMELSVNHEKTKHLNATKSSFDFLGFTFRYTISPFGDRGRYWNVIPSVKNEKNFRMKLKDYFSHNGHKNPTQLSKELNPILRGWINYCTIPGVSYPKMSKQKMKWYLANKLQRFYYRKSQRKCKLYRQIALDVLINKYNLIDICKYKYV